MSLEVLLPDMLFDRCKEINTREKQGSSFSLEQAGNLDK